MSFQNLMTLLWGIRFFFSFVEFVEDAHNYIACFVFGICSYYFAGFCIFMFGKLDLINIFFLQEFVYFSISLWNFKKPSSMKSLSFVFSYVIRADKK